MTRVCPRCSTVADTQADDCPHCGASYWRRRAIAGPIALALASVATVLAGVALILSSTGDSIDNEINDQVTSVQRQVDQSVTKLQRQVDRRFDELQSAP